MYFFFAKFMPNHVFLQNHDKLNIKKIPDKEEKKDSLAQP
jgi:hypothetical protein